MLLDSCQRLLVMDLHHHVAVLLQKAKINQDYDRTQIDKTDKLAECWVQHSPGDA